MGSRKSSTLQKEARISTSVHEIVALSFWAIDLASDSLSITEFEKQNEGSLSSTWNRVYPVYGIEYREYLEYTKYIV